MAELKKRILVVDDDQRLREPVLTRQHQVEHHQVVALPGELPVHAGRVRHRPRFEALLAEITHHQFAQPRVVVHDQDPFFQFCHAQTG